MHLMADYSSLTTQVLDNAETVFSMYPTDLKEAIVEQIGEGIRISYYSTRGQLLGSAFLEGPFDRSDIVSLQDFVEE